MLRPAILMALVAATAAATPAVALAGMPSVHLSDLARLRLETLSFFLAVFLVCAKCLQLLWNWLRTDFPRLPRLTYRKAVGLLTVWALLFVVVLTMISGARELLTPGAWEKVGLTYKLAAPTPDDRSADYTSEPARRAKLERLRDALWAYARGHDGKLPGGPTDPDVAAEFWQTTDPSAVSYAYVPGRRPHVGVELVAFEPRIFGDGQLALFTSGEIRKLTAAEVEVLLPRESKP
jgi:hypothetical protein